MVRRFPQTSKHWRPRDFVTIAGPALYPAKARRNKLPTYLLVLFGYAAQPPLVSCLATSRNHVRNQEHSATGVVSNQPNKALDHV